MNCALYKMSSCNISSPLCIHIVYLLFVSSSFFYIYLYVVCRFLYPDMSVCVSNRVSDGGRSKVPQSKHTVVSLLLREPRFMRTCHTLFHLTTKKTTLNHSLRNPKAHIPSHILWSPLCIQFLQYVIPSQV